MKIESDQVVFTSGVRHGKTTGAPITMDVINKDHQKWLDIMSAEDIEDRLKSKRKITHPRPGHADLVGGIKYRFDDLRNSLERSSARETTMRVAVGAVAKRLLAELDMEIANHVVVFGGKEIDVPENLTVAEIKQRAAQSEVSIVNQEREQEIKDYIDQIKRDGDTIGGVVETVVGGVPVGLGSYVQWDRKLMQDWLKLLSLSMPLKGWNLVLALRLVIVKAAKLWMKFSGLKKTVILAVPII